MWVIAPDSISYPGEGSTSGMLQYALKEGIKGITKTGSFVSS